MCGLPAALSAWAQESAGMPWNQPAVVARVYFEGPKAYWPNPTLDLSKDRAEIEARLAEVEKKNAENVRFVEGGTIRKDEDVQPVLAKLSDIDGVLMLPLTQPTPALRPAVDALTVPALFFSRPYATHSWSAIADLRKSGKKLDVVASSSYGDLDPYMRSFRTARHMRKSKVLVGTESPNGRRPMAESYGKHFGMEFQFISGNDLKGAFQAIDERLAQKAADEFTRGALRVVEPSAKEIRDGLRFYLAIQNVMKQARANAVTIDCFGTLAANTLPGYPCIAWSKLNDVGLYGVCEADVHSTVTQMLVTSYSGLPGFVTDPAFDTSRNEVIHAHCVSATKMKGIHGPASPYIIRNHLETNEGAVLQVLMPSNETVTVARFNGPAKMLVSTAEVTGPVDSDRGCRSQVRTRVSDAEKWLQNFTAGLHRVMFYGDHTRDLERMGRLMGFELVREM
jgi:L-fucose isomerase-like protein